MDDLSNPQYYLNRELSLLSFQERVIAQAEDASKPILERLRFLFIACRNIDEFFEVRVAELKEKVALGHERQGCDGLIASDAFAKITEKAHTMTQRIYRIYNDALLPTLRQHGIHFLHPDEWDEALLAWVRKHFVEEVQQVLSPVALDRAHPLPRLVNKSLNFIVKLRGEDMFKRVDGLAILHAPRTLLRAIPVPVEVAGKPDQFVHLSSIIRYFVSDLFPGMAIEGCYQFRLTRNSDVYIREDDVSEKADLADALKDKLYTRHFGNVARLEIAHDCPTDLVEFLRMHHHLNPDDIYYCPGPVNLSRYMCLLDLVDRPDLLFKPFVPNTPKALHNKQDIFDVIRTNDVLLHHPYQSFEPVLNFIRQASVDKNVVAIKQTLYRTGPESKMVRALLEAARAGIEVTAVIELRARFDEESNLQLANLLQKAGALIVYGVFGYKTHAKMTLIVRRENGKLKRYAHLGTGNYHESTSKLYSDFGLFTYRKDLTEDVQRMFQVLTGMSKPIKLKKLWYAPITMMKEIIKHIEFEATEAEAGRPAAITARVNGLSDPKVIKALYRASNAGVKINLIVRGICCLKPGIKGISENIKVISIVGRFLEHSRVFYFFHAGAEKTYCSSADLMERNLRHRVEVCFPIEDPSLKKRVIEEGLKVCFSDSKESWELKSDGTYKKSPPNKKKPLSAQAVLLEKLALLPSKSAKED